MTRCRAVIQHAGVGTTVAAIRAGVPQVVVPKGFDQPDTAARVEALGIGLAVAWPQRHRRLAPALHPLLSERGFLDRATTLAAHIRGEDGAELTADVIDSLP